MRLIRSFFLSLRRLDWILIVVTIILTAVGLSAIYSVDLSRGETLQLFPTQIVAAGLGLLALLVASGLHVSVYQSGARVMYLAAAALLVAVLFFGVTIRGTTGWFRLSGFSFQPAELAKVALIIFLAWWIERHRRRFERWQYVFTSGLATGVLAVLIMLQPDVGSAFILSGVWFFLLLLTGTRKRYIAALIAVVAVIFMAGWFAFFQPYQKQRILTFFNPDLDSLGSGYNVTQSIIAVGSGQFFGRGLGFGSQSQLHFLPEAQTDFIFSVIAEELGFIGVAIVMFLYGLLIFRLVRIARLCRDDFSAYTVLGIALLFLIHFIVNVGGAVGLLPVTGVTLPFVSYGGSSLLINYFLIGIAQSVARSATLGYPESDS